MQIYAVVPQVRNLHVSKDLQRASGRTSGLLGLLSCGLVNLHPALAFLAECTASQPRPVHFAKGAGGIEAAPATNGTPGT